MFYIYICLFISIEVCVCVHDIHFSGSIYMLKPVAGLHPDVGSKFCSATSTPIGASGLSRILLG